MSVAGDAMSEAGDAMSVAGRWDESSVAGRRRTLSRADSGPSRGPTPLPAAAAAEPTAAASPAAAEPTVPPSPAGAEPTPLAELAVAPPLERVAARRRRRAVRVAARRAARPRVAADRAAGGDEAGAHALRQSSKLVRSPTASSVASQPAVDAGVGAQLLDGRADYASMQLGSARD